MPNVKKTARKPRDEPPEDPGKSKPPSETGSPDIIRCSECGGTFKTQRSLRTHQNEIHSETVTCYQCDRCEKCTTRSQSIAHHITHCGSEEEKAGFRKRELGRADFNKKRFHSGRKGLTAQDSDKDSETSSQRPDEAGTSQPRYGQLTDSDIDDASESIQISLGADLALSDDDDDEPVPPPAMTLVKAVSSKKPPIKLKLRNNSGRGSKRASPAKATQDSLVEISTSDDEEDSDASGTNKRKEKDAPKSPQKSSASPKRGRAKSGGQKGKAVASPTRAAPSSRKAGSTDHSPHKKARRKSPVPEARTKEKSPAPTKESSTKAAPESSKSREKSRSRERSKEDRDDDRPAKSRSHETSREDSWARRDDQNRNSTDRDRERERDRHHEGRGYYNDRYRDHRGRDRSPNRDYGHRDDHYRGRDDYYSDWYADGRGTDWESRRPREWRYLGNRDEAQRTMRQYHGGEYELPRASDRRYPECDRSSSLDSRTAMRPPQEGPRPTREDIQSQMEQLRATLQQLDESEKQATRQGTREASPPPARGRARTRQSPPKSPIKKNTQVTTASTVVTTKSTTTAPASTAAKAATTKAAAPKTITTRSAAAKAATAAKQPPPKTVTGTGIMSTAPISNPTSTVSSDASLDLLTNLLNLPNPRTPVTMWKPGPERERSSSASSTDSRASSTPDAARMRKQLLAQRPPPTYQGPAESRPRAATSPGINQDRRAMPPPEAGRPVRVTPAHRGARTSHDSGRSESPHEPMDTDAGFSRATSAPPQLQGMADVLGGEAPMHGFRLQFGRTRFQVLAPMIEHPPAQVQYLRYGPEQFGPSEVRDRGIFVMVPEIRVTPAGYFARWDVHRVTDVTSVDPRLQYGFIAQPQWGLSGRTGTVAAPVVPPVSRRHGYTWDPQRPEQEIHPVINQEANQQGAAPPPPPATRASQDASETATTQAPATK